MGVVKRFLSVPILWDSVQSVLGATQFKRELYLSKLRPPGKLLDFGCADGHIADTFCEFDYHGVDIDPVAIEVARRRFRDRPNVHFIAFENVSGIEPSTAPIKKADPSVRHFTVQIQTPTSLELCLRSPR